MKRGIAPFFVILGTLAPALCVVSTRSVARALPTTVYVDWTGEVSTIWNKARNWDPRAVPNNTPSRIYDVSIAWQGFDPDEDPSTDVDLTSRVTLSALSLEENCVLRIANDKTLSMVGDLDNSGTIQVNGEGSFTALRFIGKLDEYKAPTELTINSDGTINLAGGRISGNNESRVTNNNTIRGYGNISNMAFVNSGTIIATDENRPIIITPAWTPSQIEDGDPLGFSNDGLLEVNKLGRMTINGERGSFLSFDEDKDLGGDYIVHDGGLLEFRDADIHSISGDVTLIGTNSRITDLPGNDAFRNFGKIYGAATFALERRSFTISQNINPFVNLGTISVGTNSVLKVENRGIVMNGTVGTIDYDGTIEISAGTLELNGPFAYVHNGDVVVGGVNENNDPIPGDLVLNGGGIGDRSYLFIPPYKPVDGNLFVNDRGTVHVRGTLNHIDSAVSIDEQGVMNVESGATIAFNKRSTRGIDNDGTISLKAGSRTYFEFPQLTEDVGNTYVYGGDGTLLLNDAQIGSQYGGGTLQNDGVIQGFGSIGTGKLQMENGRFGTILAKDQNKTLVLNADSKGFTNSGLLEVRSGATMIVRNENNSFTSLVGGTYLNNGVYDVRATLQIDNADIHTNGTEIYITGGRIIDQFGQNALRHLHVQDKFGVFSIGSMPYTIDCALNGDFLNHGELTAVSAGVLTLANGYLRNQDPGLPGIGAVIAESFGTVRLQDIFAEGGEVRSLSGGTAVFAGNTRLNIIDIITELGGAARVEGSYVPLWGNLENEGQFQIVSGASFSLDNAGSFTTTNEGRISITGDTAAARLLIKHIIDLDGEGVVEMSGDARIAGDSLTTGNVLRNYNKISGNGTIDLSNLSLENYGSITATSSTPLFISPASSIPSNTGVIEGVGGTMWLMPGSYDNNGTMRAASGGTLKVDRALIEGGEVVADTGGVVSLKSGTLSSLNLITSPDGVARVETGPKTVMSAGAIQNAGRVEVSGGATFLLDGVDVTNSGVVSIASNSTPATVLISGEVDHSGSGAIAMSGQAFIKGDPASSSNMLINRGNIRGSGTIDLQDMLLDNQGSILGSDPNQPLVIAPASAAVDNSGVIGAVGGGTMRMMPGTYDNGGSVNAGGGLVHIDHAIVNGGNVEASGGGEVRLDHAVVNNAAIVVHDAGTVRAPAGTDAPVSGRLENQAGGTVLIDNNSSLEAAPGYDFQNAGQVVVAGGPLLGTLKFQSSNTLYGGGIVRLTGDGAQIITGHDGDTLTNADNTIRGGGAVGAATMHLINRGRIIADTSTPLVLDAGLHTINNLGVFRVESASQLILPAQEGTFINFSRSSSTLSGGTYEVAGTFKFTDAHVVTNRANVLLDGPNWKMLDQNDNDALVDFNDNAADGRFWVMNGARFAATGSFQNSGSVTIGAASFMLVPDDEEYRQDAGLTRVDGLLTAHHGVFIDGGILDGVGTIDGPVTIQHGGQFNPGHSPALFTIIGSLENKPDGIFNIELGGRELGTAYDSIAVSNAAVFDGTMNVSLYEGFDPVLGDRFKVVRHDTFSGTFATMNLPALGPGLGWRVEYNPQDLTLVVVPEPSAAMLVTGAVMLLGCRGRRF